MPGNPVTIPQLMEWKKSQRKITALTAFDFLTARALDNAGIDLVLVGDSLAMVALGHDTTLPVTVDEMLHHTRAVGRALKRALLVGDMPFMSYQSSTEQAVANAGRFLKEAGAQAVKLEGGAQIESQVKAIVAAGIPVMGHLGLTPQSVHQLGGYKVQGKSYLDARRIKADAVKLQKAGAFALVLEAIPADLAGEITGELDIPTIGIGAGSQCDGQILVTQDMLGMNPDFVPKFVKQFADIGKQMELALKGYAKEVQEQTFPEAQHSYLMDSGNIKSVKQKKTG
ncbi:MAG: 3-methyl-2-oxobutanoate hydroxymethyltransferase [Candidatus Nitronauta litoralis]|uniref:3-methyl-2-oxobutanoate hydroxymethyltransferase n=1 Tax=Candidatus Nitronauta litoralis TaxID=2705533 RepID=A0A7T0BXH8_9BACT|nr:MAG: 3-methyl-2-oxobutanoate hydroxymethyltransferase [Candidatus Nitronauta litoralis]